VVWQRGRGSCRARRGRLIPASCGASPTAEGGEGDSTRRSAQRRQHRFRAAHAERGRDIMSAMPPARRSRLTSTIAASAALPGRVTAGPDLLRRPRPRLAPLAVPPTRQPARSRHRRPSGLLSGHWTHRLATPTAHGVRHLARRGGTGEPVEDRAVIRSTGREVSPGGRPTARRSPMSAIKAAPTRSSSAMPTVPIACRLPSSRDAGRQPELVAGRQDLIFDASSDHGREVFTVPAAPAANRSASCSMPPTRPFRAMAVDLFQSRARSGRRRRPAESASPRAAEWRRPAGRIGRRK